MLSKMEASPGWHQCWKKSPSSQAQASSDAASSSNPREAKKPVPEGHKAGPSVSKPGASLAELTADAGASASTSNAPRHLPTIQEVEASHRRCTDFLLEKDEHNGKPSKEPTESLNARIIELQKEVEMWKRAYEASRFEFRAWVRHLKQAQAASDAASSSPREVKPVPEVGKALKLLERLLEDGCSKEASALAKSKFRACAKEFKPSEKQLSIQQKIEAAQQAAHKRNGPVEKPEKSEVKEEWMTAYEDMSLYGYENYSWQGQYCCDGIYGYQMLCHQMGCNQMGDDEMNFMAFGGAMGCQGCNQWQGQWASQAGWNGNDGQYDSYGNYVGPGNYGRMFWSSPARGGEFF